MNLTGALLAVALGLLCSASASAAASTRLPITNRAVGPVRSAEIAMYVKQGLSPTVADRAVFVQSAQASVALLAKLKAAMGYSYAGAWFVARTAKLHLGVNSTASRRAAERVLAANAAFADAVVLTPVRSTWSQLQVAQRRWGNKFERLFKAHKAETALSAHRNALLVRLSNALPAAQRAAIAREARTAAVNTLVNTFPDREFRIVTEANVTKCNLWVTFEAYCSKPLTPGTSLESSNNERCTTGPLVLSKLNRFKSFALTAGHCIEKGGGVGGAWFTFTQAAEESEIGPATSAIWNAAADVGVIKIKNPGSWALAGRKPVYPVTADWKQRKEQSFPVTGKKEPAEGDANCVEGQSTGSQCGTVTALGVTNGITNGLVEESATVVTAGGDSGAPVVAETEGSEFVVEGTHVGKTVGGRSVFEPLSTSLTELAALKLELLTPTNETRPAEPEFLKSPVKVTTEGGEALIETLEKRALKCKASKGEGEITSATELKNLVVKFTGCKGKFSLGEAACKSSGGAAEEIVTNKIKGVPVYLSNENKEIALRGEPQEAGGLFAEVKCESGLIKETVKIKGTKLWKLTPVNTSTKEYTLSSTQEKGKPKPSEYENEKGEKVKPAAEVKGEGTLTFGYEAAGTEETQSPRTAEAIEIGA